MNNKKYQNLIKVATNNMQIGISDIKKVIEQTNGSAQFLYGQNKANEASIELLTTIKVVVNVQPDLAYFVCTLNNADDITKDKIKNGEYKEINVLRYENQHSIGLQTQSPYTNELNKEVLDLYFNNDLPYRQNMMNIYDKLIFKGDKFNKEQMQFEFESFMIFASEIFNIDYVPDFDFGDETLQNEQFVDRLRMERHNLVSEVTNNMQNAIDPHLIAYSHYLDLSAEFKDIIHDLDDLQIKGYIDNINAYKINPKVTEIEITNYFEKQESLLDIEIE